MTTVGILDHVAVFIFALTGALTASRAQLDIVGFVFLAALTGLGGGTVRDLLLDRQIFWIDRPSYLGFAAVAAILVFFTAHMLDSSPTLRRYTGSTNDSKRDLISSAVDACKNGCSG